MVKQSVYSSRSQVSEKVFSEAVSPQKMLVVPMDFAKREHTAQLCRGTGDFLLKNPLKIYNDSKGADYLQKRIQGICKKYHIPKSCVLIGGEDPPAYVWNFIHRIRHDHGYAFVRVNAYDAKRFRTNKRASSDNLDLNGIGQCLINRRARDIEEYHLIYTNLKRASRSRRKLVRSETAAKNSIHDCVSILFPGYLSESATTMVPFSSASLWLMEENFSLVKIKRMRMDTLVKGLRRHRAMNPEKVATKLKAMTETALSPPPELIPYHSKSLSTKIAFLRSIRESIKVEENEMARCLIQTPSFFLTSFPGVGVVLAGGISAEYGDPSHWRHTDNMASYAGIVPRQKQSGGSDKRPTKGHLPLDANRIARDWLLQAAYHVGTTYHPCRPFPDKNGTHRLMNHYQRIENNQGRSRLSTAKLLLRISRKMVTNERVYLPSDWVKMPAPSGQELFRFLDCANQALEQKWKKYDLSGIDDDANHLVKWKAYCDELIKSSTTQNSVSAPE